MIKIISDVHGPFSFPHGLWFTIASQLFTLLAVIMSIATLTSCNFLRSAKIPEENEDTIYLGYGFISRQTTSTLLEPPSYGSYCIRYTEVDVVDRDGPWKAGLALNVLAMILGIFIFGMLLCTCCVSLEMSVFSILTKITMLCFVLQSLVFVAWASKLLCSKDNERDCSWGKGSSFNIFTSLLWLWAANMIKSFPEVLPSSTSNNTRIRIRRINRNNSSSSNRQGDDDENDDVEVDDDDDDDDDPRTPPPTQQQHQNLSEKKEKSKTKASSSSNNNNSFAEEEEIFQ